VRSLLDRRGERSEIRARCLLGSTRDSLVRVAGAVGGIRGRLAGAPLIGELCRDSVGGGVRRVGELRGLHVLICAVYPISQKFPERASEKPTSNALPRCPSVVPLLSDVAVVYPWLSVSYARTRWMVSCVAYMF